MTKTQKETLIIKETDMTPTTDVSDAIKLAVVNTEIKHLSDAMQRIEGKFDSAISNFATNERLAEAQLRADAKHKEQDKAIKELKEWNTWAVRIVLGAVLLAGLGVVLVKNQ